ncbi:MAG: acetate--CoA ligase [archaeon]
MLEEHDILNKDDLSFEPNLKDYEATYKDFKWEDHHDELSWWVEGKLNAAYNAIDRHVENGKGDKIALIYLDDNGTRNTYTFSDLKRESDKFANALTNLGIKKGDRVFLFMPRIPEQYIAFLGALKTGAIGGTLFQAFGPAALKDRLQDCGAIALVTSQDLKSRVYEVKDDLPELKHIIVAGGDEDGELDVSFERIMGEASEEFDCVHTDAEDPAFMLYTSGTTGKPKGVVHVHMSVLQQHMTAKWVLDIKDSDIYWCTADPGWVTGIAYTILGTWSNAVTSVVHNGRFKPERWYQILQDEKVTVWYTAPTAIRMLMKAGDEAPKGFDLSGVRHALSVGEPLNPEAIKWGAAALNMKFHDTWWQTETGAMMIVNYACLPIRIGSMGKPFPGIHPAIVDDEGKELGPHQEGNLCVKPGWPSMMRSVWGRQEKYDSYFQHGWYVTGDRAYKDEDGYVWFVGRADDVIKTAGERVGPFEVESALVEHPAVVEAGVIGKPDPDRGQIIKAFVTLAPDRQPNDELAEELKQWVKKHMAGHAYPREIEFRDSLPKTRSGKIMRRVLKAEELGQDVGDTSTMEDL